MFTNEDLVERIEDAMRVSPFCHFCWSPTTVIERDEALWLDCSTLSEPRGGLRALLTLDFPSRHTQREIVALRPAA
jgi:hypothetical protein